MSVQEASGPRVRVRRMSISRSTSLLVAPGLDSFVEFLRRLLLPESDSGVAMAPKQVGCATRSRPPSARLRSRCLPGLLSRELWTFPISQWFGGDQ